MAFSGADIDRLRALVKNRTRGRSTCGARKIVVLGADGVGANGIIREAGKSKTCVRRWQESFVSKGPESLLRDKTLSHC
jgi:hypothetical protein